MVINYLASHLSAQEQRIYREALSVLGRGEDVVCSEEVPAALREKLWKRQFVSEAKDKLKNWAKKGTGIVCLSSPAYPPALNEIFEPPFVLYYRGAFPTEWKNHVSVSIVGTRRPDAAGLEIARRFGRECGECGLSVVSGIAMGVDAAAHEGALDSPAVLPTIAILAHGVDIEYPVMNHRLYRRLLDQGGLLLSHFEPGERPFPANFLSRNRIIAGLSPGVIVIQAGLRSGSLVTARFALEEGREVMVVPGGIQNPHYEGSNALIREGASLVRNMEDILHALGIRAGNGRSAPGSIPFSPPQEKIINVLASRETVHYDTLARDFPDRNMLAHEVLQLELLDVITRRPGNLLALQPHIRKILPDMGR